METVKLIIELMDGTQYRKVISFENSEDNGNTEIAEWIAKAEEGDLEISATHKYSFWNEAQLELPELDV